MARYTQSESVSDFPKKGIQPSFGYVFADGKILPTVKKWFDEQRGTIPQQGVYEHDERKATTRARLLHGQPTA